MVGIARTSDRHVAEVALVFFVIGTYLWFGRASSSVVTLGFAAVLLAILVYAHWHDGERLRDIGFRRDTFGATSWLLLPIVVIGGGLILTVGTALGEMHFPSPATGAWRFAQFVALGIAQQYALLGFVFRRLERVGDQTFAIALTASVFALLHLPNVWLTAVTFVWGVIACLVYRRSPNLWANGLAHGILAALVYFALPRSVTGALRVGMDYFVS